MLRILILGFWMSVSVAAQAHDYLTIESADGVRATMDRLEATVRAKGLSVFSRIDHAAGAEGVGMALAPNEVLIFGNPKLGTLLMQQNGRIGVDLGMKISVWQDADGRTCISYRSAPSLAQAHGLDPNSEPFKKMAGALAALAKAASGS